MFDRPIGLLKYMIAINLMFNNFSLQPPNLLLENKLKLTVDSVCDILYNLSNENNKVILVLEWHLFSSANWLNSSKN